MYLFTCFMLPSNQSIVHIMAIGLQGPQLTINPKKPCPLLPDSTESLVWYQPPASFPGPLTSCVSHNACCSSRWVEPGNKANHTPTRTSDSAFYGSQWSENEVGPSIVCILSSPEIPPPHCGVCSFRPDIITSFVHVWREESEKVKMTCKINRYHSY